MNHDRGRNGGQAPSKDHRIPVSRGGLNLESNLVVCCRWCNEDKGALFADEYMAWREGTAFRLDHGWWQKKRAERPDLPRYPYAHYSRLWFKLGLMQIR